MNTKEIQQSFLNLNTFINSSIFDQRQQLHLYFDRQISSLSDNYSLNKVISKPQDSFWNYYIYLDFQIISAS